MQILTIRKRDSKHWNANSKHSKMIRTIRKTFEAFQCKSEAFERDLKHSNGHSKIFVAIEWKFEPSKWIRSIRMQIRIIKKRFEAFKSKLEPFERNSNHSNANSNHSKEIRSIGMQIRNIRKGFKAFECIFEPFERDS